MKTTFVDLKNTDLYRDGIPHEVFARLRREAPVAWNPENDGRGFWAVTRYEDIVAVSKRPEVFSSDRKHGGHRMFDENVTGVAGVGAEKTEAPMISMDPPEHNQYRRMVSPGLPHGACDSSKIGFASTSSRSSISSRTLTLVIL